MSSAQKRPWPRRFLGLVEFFFFYLFEVVISNLRIAAEILTPKHRMDPAFVAVDLEPMSDWQLMILANLITMTPGTLSMDIHPDRSRLYIHALYVGDPETFRRKVKNDYERRILRVF